MGIETTDKSQCPITKEFLEKVLKRKITSFKVGEGSNPGDNFLAILFSLEIYFENHSEPAHLLFKTFPNHPTRQKILSDTNIFLKEYLVYDVWIQELLNFQKDLVGNEKILIPSVPKLVAGAAIDYTKDDVDWNADPMLSNFILMVDERKNEFSMANKLLSLDYHHVKVVLDELSKLHALGYAYRVHEGVPNIRSLFPFMEDSIFGNDSQRPTLTAMLQLNMSLIKDSLESFLSNNPEIAKSFSKLDNPDEGIDLLHMFLNPDGMDEEKVEDLQRVKRYSGKPLKDQWIVPGHGDCWTNNMLFKKDDNNGKVTDAILVDLQIVRESCIMADIVYFFYTSTDTEFRKKYLNEMLEWYFTKFSDYCKTLKVEPFANFTLDNFKRKFHRSKIFGFIFASIVLPIILVRPESSLNLDTVEIEKESVGDEKDDLASLMSKGQSNRDDDDKKLLRKRFTSLLMELHDEGVL